MALRLDVRLGKPGVYLLHAAGQAATAATLQAARRLARHAVIAAAALIAALAWALRMPP
ncbi:MAG: cobalamin biosynthesis protein, partial [Proteobacteria bacterium]|nr:cobalamin biosynthesis protein [Pseudomonadota bacterium]